MWPVEYRHSSWLVEAIAQAAHRAENYCVSQLGAHSRDVHLNCIGCYGLIPARHGLLQTFFGDDPSRVEREAFDDQPLAARQLERPAIHEQLASGNVDTDPAQGQLAAGVEVEPPDERAAAGRELALLEGLDEEVIGPEIQRFYFRGECFPGGEDHRWHVRSRIPQAAQESQAIDARERYVKQYEVEVFGGQRVRGLFGFRHTVDSEPGHGQSTSDGICHEEIIFHNPDAHGTSMYGSQL
jgi:hypothetical protein